MVEGEGGLKIFKPGRQKNMGEHHKSCVGNVAANLRWG